MPEMKVTLKKHESIEKALKRLKRVMDGAGVLRELKERRYFVKPGDQRRKKSERARARAKKEARESEYVRH